MSNVVENITTLREAEQLLPPDQLPSTKKREILHPNRITGYGLVLSYSGLVTWLTGQITLNPILEYAGLGMIGAGFACDAADGKVARSHPMLQTSIGKSFDPLVDKLVNYPTQLVILISFLLTIGFSPVTITMALITVLGAALDIYSTKIRLQNGQNLSGHLGECMDGCINPKDCELATPESKGGANALGKIKTVVYSVTNAAMMLLMTTCSNAPTSAETASQSDGNETLATIGLGGYVIAFASSVGSLIKKKLSKR